EPLKVCTQIRHTLTTKPDQTGQEAYFRTFAQLWPCCKTCSSIFKAAFTSADRLLWSESDLQIVCSGLNQELNCWFGSVS
ncbi:hypothetical protein LDENG_00262510, partial [Lucifuga dentata]